MSMRGRALILAGAVLVLVTGCGSAHSAGDNVLAEVEAAEGRFEAEMAEIRAHPGYSYQDGGWDAHEKAVLTAPERTVHHAQELARECVGARRSECDQRKEVQEGVAELENENPGNEEFNTPQMTAESRALVAAAERIRGEVEAAPRDTALHRELVDRADRLLRRCESDFGLVECDRRAMLESIAVELPALGR
jgi:hypothetical protein